MFLTKTTVELAYIQWHVIYDQTPFYQMLAKHICMDKQGLWSAVVDAALI